MGPANPQALPKAQEEMTLTRGRGSDSRWADGELDRYIEDRGPILGFQSQALFREAVTKFPRKAAGMTLGGFRQHALHIKASKFYIPSRETPLVTEQVLRVPWKTALVTGDYQIPYHDEEFTKFAFKLGAAWNVEGHVVNADFYDMASISKFPQQMYGERVQLGEEFEVGKDILNQSRHLHRNVAYSTGNHEWRLLVRTLHGELDSESARQLLAGEGVLWTPLSYLWLGYDNEPVRITHPRAQSVIAGTVGADISRNHDCHVIVAHDHLLCQRRSHSGRWTVTHAGMMANPSKLMYAVTADDRRPRMNQGFVIVHPDSKTGQPRIRLIDAKNCDQELELWIAERRGEHNNGMEKRRKTVRPKPKRS